MIQTVIDLLVEARLRELEAIDQYMIHRHELKNRGLDQLASKIEEIAIVKMKHAEKLAESPVPSPPSRGAGEGSSIVRG